MRGSLITSASIGPSLGSVEAIGLAIAIVKMDWISHDTRKGIGKLKIFKAGIVECKRCSSSSSSTMRK